MLYLRPLDSLEARALPATEDAGRPFWSPDSKSLGFFANGKLKRIDVTGGVPLTLCDTPEARGGTWNQDGVILYTNRSGGLQRISASGGAPTPATTVDSAKGELGHSSPQFLPGGQEFLYLVWSSDAASSGIYWGSLNGKTPVRIRATAFNGLYDANAGRLLFIQGDGTLMAQKLDLNPPRLNGDPLIVAQGVKSSNVGYSAFSISATGTLFHGRGNPVSKRRLVWWDRSGKPLESIGLGPPNFTLSPDGNRIAYTAGTPPDIWVMSLASGIASRVSFSGGHQVRWSPDGKQLYYGNAGGIYRRAADGSGEEELKGRVQDTFMTSISPDGKQFLLGRFDILILPLEGEAKSTPYLQTKFIEGFAAFSPDGRWVAYESDESGRSEIYIQGFPERRGKLQVSAEGGRTPQWRADGKELYWSGINGSSVMAAPMELQSVGGKSGRPELLFRVPSSFATLDGKRFLVAEPEGGQQQALPMAVVTNWAAGLPK